MFKIFLVAYRDEVVRRLFVVVRDFGVFGFGIIALAACNQTGTAEDGSGATSVSQENASLETASTPPATPSPKLGSIVDGRATDEHKESEFRPNVTVNFAYDQLLGGGYSSSWWISLDKINRNWVDVYYETNEKLSYSGILSFNCGGANDIGVMGYGSDWGNADTKTLYVVKPSMIQEWQKQSQNESLSDPFPPLPHQVYLIARKKFC